jgi:hypothetical protein
MINEQMSAPIKAIQGDRARRTSINSLVSADIRTLRRAWLISKRSAEACRAAAAIHNGVYYASSNGRRANPP